MTYNLHPILVHFPIALLFLYSIIKILPLRKWFPKVAWKDIERLLLFFGVLGAFAALATGDTAEHLVHPNRQLVNAHSNFGIAATWLYGTLLLGEIVEYLNSNPYIKKYRSISSMSIIIERILCNPTFSTVLTVVALIAISLTGMLGGVIAYGLSADPFSAVALKLLGITYP